MVTQLSGTQRWVFNLERGEALRKPGSPAIIDVSSVGASHPSDLCIQYYSLNKHAGHFSSIRSESNISGLSPAIGPPSKENTPTNPASF